MEKVSLIRKFNYWRIRHISNRQFLLILSIIIGLGAGFGAVIIRMAVHHIKEVLQHGFSEDYQNYLFFAYPAIGITLTVFFIKYINKNPVRHGIPNVLYCISKKNGKINSHNMYSSVITSALTVGFGGSVGLEGPTVATGAAIGSNLSSLLRLNYKQITLMLGCASAGAMAAIFKAPLAAIAFAVEIIMIDLTSFSLAPLILSSTSALITSYLFLGKELSYPVTLTGEFIMEDLPFYLVLGIFTGLVSVYFTRMYMYIGSIFERINRNRIRILTGSISLGIIIFLFPSLYGDGYEAINECLSGNSSYLFNQGLFYSFQDNLTATILLLIFVIIFKVIATSITFGAGGIGGIFAPTLFMGANAGFLFSLFTNNVFGLKNLNHGTFALVGMAGLISGVLHAPLTGIFLIADITGGYQLFLPLMITATFAYLTARYFESNSVYTIQLAKRKELITHDKDKAVLSLMNVYDLLETDFRTLHPDDSLGDLIQVISEAHRNVFPVVDKNNYLKGILKMDDIRNIMFKQELYDKVFIKDLMYMPEHSVSVYDTMEEIANKIQTSGRFNIPVIEDGKYLGFVSRANVFSAYQKMLSEFSED